MGAGFSDAVDAARSSRALVTLIERALETLTDKAHAKEIARLAFDMAPDDLDRHDAEQLALFIHGPLAEAVEEVLGPAAIDTVCNYVERASSLHEPDPDDSGVMHRPDPIEDPDTLRTGPRPIVLLVSSDEALRDEIDPWLSEAGYALVWCPEPDTVIAQCTTVLPQLAILDEDMPGLQRRNVVGLVRHALGREAPPLVSIGRMTPESTRGLDAFVRRPLDRGTLVAEINRCAAPPEGYTPPPSPIPEDEDDGARLVYVLEEAMGRLVAKPVKDAIVADALGRAQTEAVPTDVTGFTEFVVGPLRDAVRDALGSELTEALLTDLEPVIVHARESSGLQRRRSAAAQAPALPRTSRRGHVLVLADVAARRRMLCGQLTARGYHVDHVDDAHAALERCAKRRPDAVVVQLVGSVVRESQFCALLTLTLGEHRPVVIVCTDDEGARVPSADRVMDGVDGPVADALDELLELDEIARRPR